MPVCFRQCSLNFDNINAHLSNVHHAISHCRPMSNEDIQKADRQNKDYMQLYRQLFPNKTTPKHHILEIHCIPFIKSTKLGLGATGEHGIEASHQSLAKIEKRASGIMSATQKSKFLLNSSLLQNYQSSDTLRNQNLQSHSCAVCINRRARNQ